MNTNMLCSLFFASFLCFPPMPVICNQYDLQSTFTGYTLSVEETDDSPTTGAWGDDLSELNKKFNICASRKYSRGTIIEISGIGRCYIFDRVSLKYSKRIDILFPTKQEALRFGKQTLQYRIIK